MAATVVTTAVPADHDSERCGSEEENRGAEATEESRQQQTGPAAAVAAAAAAATHSRLSKLPLARIKALMKSDPDVSLASQESVFIIAKATVNGPSVDQRAKLFKCYNKTGDMIVIFHIQ